MNRWKPGAKGKVRLSNRTDNESAKMATSRGVIHGYCGVAAVDAKHQIVIDTQAHGTSSEQELLLPVVEATAPFRTAETVITADAGYHSVSNLKQLAESEVKSNIPDNGYRQRDERYTGPEAHKAKPDPLHDKRGTPSKKNDRFKPKDFQFNLEQKTGICPAGKRLYGNGGNCTINGFAAMKF